MDAIVVGDYPYEDLSARSVGFAIKNNTVAFWDGSWWLKLSDMKKVDNNFNELPVSIDKYSATYHLFFKSTVGSGYYTDSAAICGAFGLMVPSMLDSSITPMDISISTPSVT